VGVASPLSQHLAVLLYYLLDLVLLLLVQHQDVVVALAFQQLGGVGLPPHHPAETQEVLDVLPAFVGHHHHVEPRQHRLLAQHLDCPFVKGLAETDESVEYEELVGDGEIGI
jgi:hypothetical protein